MTEVQYALYNKDSLKGLSDFIFISYKKFETLEDFDVPKITEDSTGPHIEKSENFLTKFFRFIAEIFNRIIKSLKELYYSIKEVLPLIFDKLIEQLLLYSKKTKKPLLITFKQIFEIFQIFGLEDIYPETFDKINAALQWKICTINWIDISFLYSYRESLLSNTSTETFDAINDLYESLELLRKEEENNRIFEEDISRILD